MSKELKKYIREQKSKDDKLQSRFIDGNIVKPEDKVKQEAKKEKINIDIVVYCPFCLFRAKLIKFLITDSKGEVSTYRVRCPECKVGMLMRTISAMHYMTDKKIQSYARWVVDYRKGFWSKVNKKVWDKRLKEYQWSGIFWVEYKKLKASLPREEGDYYD